MSPRLNAHGQGARSRRRAVEREVRDRRAEFLDAAHTLLLQRQGEEATIIEIGAQAEANPSLIGYYFGGKDGLYAALLRRILSTRLSDLLAVLAAEMPPAQRLEQYVRGTVLNFAAYPYISRLTARVVAHSTPAEAQDLTASLVAPLARAHRDILRRCAARKISEDDLMHLYYIVLGACSEVFTSEYTLSTVFLMDSVGAAQVQRLSELVTDMLVRTLGANGAEGPTSIG